MLNKQLKSLSLVRNKGLPADDRTSQIMMIGNMSVLTSDISDEENHIYGICKTFV